MYAAYDIRRLICDGEFSKPSYLCLAVHMCLSPICDIRCPICNSDFLNLDASQIGRRMYCSRIYMTPGQSSL